MMLTAIWMLSNVGILFVHFIRAHVHLTGSVITEYGYRSRTHAETLNTV